MDVLDIFLNEIRRRIHIVSADVTEIADKRNKALEIENILFTNKINKKDIKIDDLLKLSIEDFNKLIELATSDSNKINADKFNKYKNIINLYKEISQQGEISSASQYNEAKNYFNDIINALKRFLNDYTSENVTGQIDSKEVVNVLKNIENAFSGGKLIMPVLEIDKFNRIIEFCNLTPLQKGQLKKKIGVENLRVVLLPSNQRDEEQELLLKYKVILNKRLNKAKSYLNILGIFIQYNELKIDINITNEQLKFFIEGNPTLSFKEVINGIMYILLERELKRFDDMLASDHTDEARKKLLTEVIRNCDKILLLGDLELEDIKAKAPEVPKQDEEKPKELNDEAKKVFDSIKDILKEESHFLQGIHPDDYNRFNYLLEIIHAKETSGDKDEAYESYRLAMLIESLRQELKAFEIIASRYAETPKEFEANYVQQVIKINSLIEAYMLLRKRRPGQKIKDNNKLLYLVDKNNQALINVFMEQVSNDKRKQIIEMLDKLTEVGNNKQLSELLISKDKFEIEMIKSKNIYLNFIKLSDDDIIVVSAGNRARKNEDNKFETLLDDYGDEINKIIETIKNPADRQILYEEQAQIRTLLANYAESLNTKTKQSQKVA